MYPEHGFKIPGIIRNKEQTQEIGDSDAITKEETLKYQERQAQGK